MKITPDKHILFTAAAVTAAAGSVCLASMVIDNHRFVTRRYSVISDKLSSPVRLVYLTDLHEKVYGNDNTPLIEAVKAAEPDLILVGGDLIVSGQAIRNGKRGDWWYRHSISLMERLVDMAPVMMAEGNHELRLHRPELDCMELYDRLREAVSKAGVRWLSNESARFGELMISGLELPYPYYEKFRWRSPDPETIGYYLGGADKDAFVVLLAHNPAFFPAYAAWGADLTLSGHLHGGLMRLPLVGGVVSPSPALFPRYSNGQYRLGGREMVVSCGMGMHTLPIRIFNPAELSVIDLKPGKGPG